MSHHVRSGIAIAFASAYLGISLLLDHRPADWEYVFLMFVVFSSASQDAMDDLTHRVEKLTRVAEESQRNTEYLKRDIQQEFEYLKSHITAEVNLIKYDLALRDALEKGEEAPEAAPYPEPKLVPLEAPKLESFDPQKWRTEKIQAVATALGTSTWWDMTVVLNPVRRFIAYVMSRPSFIRWIARD